jgi:hypothetical protein
MGLPKALPQPIDGYMRVDLSGRQAGMAEQFLNRSQICSAIEQVSGSGVPQPVRGQAAFGDPCGGPIDDGAGSPLVKASAATTE